MEDWLRTNTEPLLAAAATLLVAVIGVLAAEGGGRRRALRQARELLEIRGQLAAQAILPGMQSRLAGRTLVDLQDYLSVYRRNRRRAYTAMFLVFLAAEAYAVAKLTQVTARDDPWGFVTVLFVLVMPAALLIVLIAYMVGIARFLVHESGPKRSHRRRPMTREGFGDDELG